MKFLIATLIVFSQAYSFAQTSTPPNNEPTTWEKVKEKSDKAVDAAADQVQKVSNTLDEAREVRTEKKWSANANLVFFDTYVLTKYGATISYNESVSTTYELEYLRGSLGFNMFSIDLGKLTEQRISLLKRSFSHRNSFNFFWGAYYYTMDAHLGDDLLANVSGVPQASVDLMKFSSAGVSWGFGNRWSTKKGWVWGADWLTLSLPLFTLKDETPYFDATTDDGERDDVHNVWEFMKRFPLVSVVKFQLGASF